MNIGIAVNDVVVSNVTDNRYVVKEVKRKSFDCGCKYTTHIKIGDGILWHDAELFHEFDEDDF